MNRFGKVTLTLASSDRTREILDGKWRCVMFRPESVRNFWLGWSEQEMS